MLDGMLDAGLGAGCWVLGAGRTAGLDTYSIAGHWALGAGRWTLDARCCCRFAPTNDGIGR